jgi:hypothetical protein
MEQDATETGLTTNSSGRKIFATEFLTKIRPYFMCDVVLNGSYAFRNKRENAPDIRRAPRRYFPQLVSTVLAMLETFREIFQPSWQGNSAKKLAL